MRTKYIIVSAIGMTSVVSCSSLDNGSRTGQDKFAGLNEKFQAFDLSCDYSTISAAPAQDKTQPQVQPQCNNAREYYAMLLEKFDANKDGKLTDDELAKSQGEFEMERLHTLDKNGDGKLSDDEVATWRSKDLPTRQKKLEVEFSHACGRLQKDDDTCKALYDVRREDRRKEVEVHGNGVEVHNSIEDTGRSGRRSDR